MITKELVREAILMWINYQLSLGKTVDLSTLHQDPEAQFMMKHYVLSGGKLTPPKTLCIMMEGSKEAKLYDKYYWEVIEEIRQTQRQTRRTKP